ncbi:MAG: LysM peptidoglycan-binding domain-containing protein, partial [Thermomicrobiales bacterium]
MPDSTHPRRQPGPDRSEGGGGIVDLYAKRVAANAASRDTTADQDDAPPVTEWIGRGSELESVDDPGPGGSNDGATPRLSFATGARRLLRLGSRRGRVAIGGLLVASLALSALSGVAHAQQRYTVRDGDTLGGVAARFGVDPDAILNASWVANPGTLTAGDVIVIPDPGQDPADAAAEAAQREGTSPWVSAAYDVQANDTIAEIAATYGVAADDLLALNNLTWNDDIFPGQRLLIPADATVRAEPESGGAQFDGGAVPSGGGAFAGVPLHQQERSLSCEYAAAFIATSAYGAGIP